MKIAAIQRFSLIDYPGKICAVLFTLGCNFKCPYCHNPELVMPQKFSPLIQENEIATFLQNRKNKLDAITVTGGEPCLQKDLLEFLKKIKKMQYKIKLDTNGSYPSMLEKIIEQNLVDYIAMDIKAPYEKYPALSGYNDITSIKKSIDLIINSELDHEFRTTVVKHLLDKKDIKKIIQQIKRAKRYTLQNFCFQGKILDQKLGSENTFSKEKFSEFKILGW